MVGMKAERTTQRTFGQKTSSVIHHYATTCHFLTLVQRFHIKWKNFSHLHNTDETYEFLKRFKGFKRVDNYIKAYRAWKTRVDSPNLSSEDREALFLDKEREKEDLETYRTVERIVSHREGPGGDVEYFCKWNGLNYDHCTWELQKDVNPIAKQQIEAYRTREMEAKFPYKSAVYSRYGRPAFARMDKEPDFITATGCHLKDFQLTGLNWLAYTWSCGHNGILADEMGLGKVCSNSQCCLFIHLSTVDCADCFASIVAVPQNAAVWAIPGYRPFIHDHCLAVPIRVMGA